MLTEHDLNNLRVWKYSVDDPSITTQVFSPFWRYLTSLMPAIVAPNVISFVGLLCTMYSWYLIYFYLDYYPILIPILSDLLIFAYFNLDAVDGMHARATKNGSPMGELFDHACDNITLVFLIMGVTQVLGITNPKDQWMIVQGASLLFMLNHLEALQKGVVQFGRYNGPGEFLMLNIAIILGRVVTNYSWFNYITNMFGETRLFSILYGVILLYTLGKIMTLKNHYETKNGLLISLSARTGFSMLYLNVYPLDTFTVISHGLIMTILASDLIVSKMSKRELHPLIPVMIFLSLPSNWLCVFLCAFYHIMTLCQISYSLKIPLLSVRNVDTPAQEPPKQVNVFCCGVWDMMHAGHMKLFKNASVHGTRLIIGVHNDADVKSYKRTPIMTHDERCEVVSLHRPNDVIVPNCPLNLTEEFIKKYDIHYVVCDEEYYINPDDKYYKVAKDKGMLHALPRTPGISTTDLIKRVKEYQGK